jgi:hypothetical protein
VNAAFPGAALDLLLLLLCGLVLAPTGYALLSWAWGGPPRLAQLGPALGLGYAALIPVLLLERTLAIPLVAPLAAVCALGVARRLGRPALTGAGGPLLASIAFGAFALAVNAADARPRAGGLDFKAGFDVSDRAFYAMVAQELARALPPSTANPAFAEVPLSYSFFPSLLVLWLHDWTGVAALAVAMLHLPVLGLAWLGLAAVALLDAMGVAGRAARGLTLCLLVMGGGLTPLVPHRNLTFLERTAPFPVFHAFAAESLTYNPWLLGLPLVLVYLWLLRELLRRPSVPGWLLVALVSGALFETKVFAWLSLLLGACLATAWSRRRWCVLAALVTALGGLPWVLLTALSPTGRDGPALVLHPLFPVLMTLQATPALEPLRHVLSGRLGTLPAVAAGALGTALTLLGGLGVRLLGSAQLRQACRSPDAPFHMVVAGGLGASLVLSFLLAGNPVPSDGAQFMLLAQHLGWFYAAPWIAGLAARGGALRALAWLLALLACSGPARYYLMKLAPEAFTSPQALDRRVQHVSSEALAACAWLDRHAGALDRLLLPLGDDAEDVGGLRSLYLAAACGRRVLAIRPEYSVGRASADSRRWAAAVFYGSDSPEAALRILDLWRVRWVWEDARSPLRFRSPRLIPAFGSGSVRIVEYRPAGPDG